MNAGNFQHRIVLLSTGYGLPDRSLLFTRARLFPDRIELSGWHPSRPHRRVIPLDTISNITWPGEGAPGQASQVVFQFEDGSRETVVLRSPSHWRSVLEARMPWARPPVATWLPDLPEPAQKEAMAPVA